MELRSGRRLRSSQQPEEDRLSALPDDLLLLILSCLRCVGTAARTGVLSRRWRNLWRLLSAFVFRNVKYSSLETALTCVSPSVVSLLEIHVPFIFKLCYTPSGKLGGRLDVSLGGAGVTSLLRAAARLDPEGLVFTLANNRVHGYVDLPSFQRATSITLESRSTSVRFHVPFDVEFSALDTMSLSGINIVGLDGLIQRCPRLRVLRLKAYDQHKVIVRSPSLQELFVDSTGCAQDVDIVAPMLGQLTMSLCPSEQANISILAPMLETVSWCCSYLYARVAIGPWRLHELRLEKAQRKGQLPSLHIHAIICLFSHFDHVANFRQEIKKHTVAAFSALELQLTTSGHVFGLFVFHLIGMKRIRSCMRKLKVVLRESRVKEKCPINCRCHPTNWEEVQTISLIALEEIQIDGFEGEDHHEFDFLKSVFKSAPMLKRVIVNLTHEDSSSSNGCTELLYDLFKPYSAVECCVYLGNALHT